MAKHDAVERLMTMATEKRADRTPEVPNSVAAVPGAANGLRAEKEAPARESAGGAGSSAQPAPARRQAATPGIILPPGDGIPVPRTSVVERGRQLLQAVRPLLPAVAGAMRLVDHGAVQAVARLLPLLGGVAGAASAAPTPRIPQGPTEQDKSARSALEFDAAQQTMRRELQALALQAAQSEDEVRRLRAQLERVSAEQAGTADEARRLGERLRLLTAGLIILLMLVIAQMLMLVLLFHR